ncbi:hypothetical protein [Pseudescherichia sp.]|uniref:hypothetical protein n=1 Tax=Pseudescherichia sp. TaxID=2055881 RepID=UPI00289FC270|nr:hypothetical protein [Pseudescherichia sp.]
MSESLNNKELVAAGHQFARLMSSDMPLIDIAKMITRLAERLDCTTAALRETVKQRDALTSDNVARAEIIGQLVWQYSASGIKPVQKSLNPASALLFDALEVLRQPATAAAVNELKAPAIPEGWRLVPLEPTPKMLAEMCLVEGWTERALKTRYQAMLAAAPGEEV